jgi:hypothetical protein
MLMADAEGHAVLHRLRTNWYGQSDGPGWGFLVDEVISSGRQAGADASIAVLDWISRTHGPPIDERNRWYKAVLKPSERFRALQAAPLHWTKTEDAEYPWECRLDDQSLRVRIGDFPIDHLYHVEIAGEKLGVVDDWPAAWTRESWLEEQPPAARKRSTRKKP